MTPTIEKYEVRNRRTGAVQFTAEISVTPDMPESVKLGLVVMWAKRNGFLLSDVDLSGAYLRDADLRGANLRGANLSHADLSGVNLSGAYLSDVDLRDADLSGVNLSHAILRHANLSHADLSGVNLSGVNLRHANLSHAHLSHAILRHANLSHVDLRPIKADFFMILAMGHAEVPHLIRSLREGNVNGSTYEGACACLVGTLENGGASGIPHQESSPAEQWFAPISKGTLPGDANEGGFRSKMALEWALEYARLTGLDVQVSA